MAQLFYVPAETCTFCDTKEATRQIKKTRRDELKTTHTKEDFSK